MWFQLSSVIERLEEQKFVSGLKYFQLRLLLHSQPVLQRLKVSWMVPKRGKKFGVTNVAYSLLPVV